MAHRSKEVAKFFSGFETFHALFHGYLWLSGTALTALGITLTRSWSVANTILHGAIALLLGLYGWRTAQPR